MGLSFLNLPTEATYKIREENFDWIARFVNLPKIAPKKYAESVGL